MFYILLILFCKVLLEEKILYFVFLDNISVDLYLEKTTSNIKYFNVRMTNEPYTESATVDGVNADFPGRRSA